MFQASAFLWIKGSTERFHFQSRQTETRMFDSLNNFSINDLESWRETFNLLLITSMLAVCIGVHFEKDGNPHDVQEYGRAVERTTCDDCNTRTAATAIALRPQRGLSRRALPVCPSLCGISMSDRGQSLPKGAFARRPLCHRKRPNCGHRRMSLTCANSGRPSA